MKVSFFHSASTKIAFRFMVVLCAAVLLLSVIFSFLLKHFVRSQQEDELQEANSKLCKSLEESDIKEYLPLSYLVTYSVFDEKKCILTNDPFLPRLKETDGKAKTYIHKNYFIDGDLNILYIAKTINKNGEQYLIETALNMDSDSMSLFLKGIPFTLALVCIPVLILSFFVSLGITKNTMKPVVRMTEQAKKISSENLGEKLPVKHSEGKMDENDELALTFNDLFLRLKTDFDREKAFTSDVSHELKTPVAVILGQSRLLQRWGKNDPAQTDKSLNMIVKEAHSMDSTIKNLLQLSRLESGRQSPVKETFSLMGLLDELREETLTYAENAKIKIILNGKDWDKAESFSINSDRELLHQTLTIIVSNSVKFCNAAYLEGTQKEPPSIVFSVTSQKGNEKNKFQIAICDNGPGFSDDVLPHIFERFYRGDASHNRAAGGSGLGLSIAKVIVKVLGGKITASNAPESRGAVLTLDFN